MRRKLWAAVLLLSLILLGTPAVTHADVNNFTVTNFTADYLLDRSDPQGKLGIDEHLDVDFTDYNHGILRALPEKYNGQHQQIRIAYVQLDGTIERYATYSSNGNLVLKIGDPNKTITGKHSYEIKYEVRNVIRFAGDRDELDWNTNGTQWQQPFTHVTAQLDVPSDLTSKLSNLTCYTGTQGSTAHDCTVSTNDMVTTFTSTRVLQAGETMTFAANFPLGTFTPPTWRDTVADYGIPIAQALVLPAVVFVIAFGYWFKKGRDIKGRGTIIPEYGPPNNLSPIEVDTVAHYKLGTKAISATIIDLAIRKYLRIVESTQDKLLGLGKTKAYNLELLNSDFSALNQYERAVVTAIFADQQQTVDLNSLKNKFYKTSQTLQKQVPADLTKAGYFTTNPVKIGSGMHVLGWLVVFGSFYLFKFNWKLAVGGILSGIILALFSFLMPRRSKQGVDAKDAIEGLKLYLEVAEKDRIAQLQSPDAPYAPQSDAPAQTVELFEKLLPYAIILGVEQQWAKKFESIYTTPPDWYSGNWTAFNAAYLVGSLNSSMAAMNTSFSAPSSSGAGGGFSGGGGGGGGGGGW